LYVNYNISLKNVLKTYWYILTSPDVSLHLARLWEEPVHV